MLTTYPVADASRRLRIEPLVAELRGRGVEVRVHELFSPFSFANKNGNLRARFSAAVRLSTRLAQRILFFVRRYDVLIVHREAFPFFTPFFERILTARAGVAVLDVDDAIYSSPTHVKDWRHLFRSPINALAFSEYFDLIFCGNDVLKDAFSNKRAQTIVFPTCPPPETFDLDRQELSEVSILWTGSQSTLGSLQHVLPEVLSLCEEEDLTLDVLGGANISSLPSHPRLRARRWSHDLEQKLLARAAIGIMPLPDTEWERGKSGYKAILYLCAGLQAVVSPVGINKELSEKYSSIHEARLGEWASSLRSAVEAVRSSSTDVSARTLARLDFDAHQNARRQVDTIFSRLSLVQKGAPLG